LDGGATNGGAANHKRGAEAAALKG
jgi:hypothetical protein